ncbi:hypothetical protein F5884DRAFT_857146 [Xylogone sp. PMI_703]|nr:hypothetical protein F5884DRAFT_857146 [Xylogone sp. PMI_703]
MSESNSPKSILRQQFENPSETLSVLLLIGGDIVQKAIAQLVGRHRVTPAAFSFGWVAYAFSGLSSAFGDGTLMPLPDCPCRVINLETGSYRQNESWVIGRFLRDLEVNFKLKPGYRRPVIIVLKTAGIPARPGGDFVWWSFVFFMPMQLFIAAWPLILPRRNWTILMIAAAGSLLAMATSSLPQWAKEKYDCRKDSKNSYIITRGNGHQHIFVIENGGLIHREGTRYTGISLNLEDLAVASPSTSILTRCASITLAILWVIFLITVGGLKQDAWFLMGVGGLGMVHNVYVASWTRTPEGNGVPLKRNQDRKIEVPCIIGGEGNMSSMKTLMLAEEKRPGLGLLLLETFFPGNLDKEEAQFWKDKRATLGDRQKDLKKILRNEAEIITSTSHPRDTMWLGLLQRLKNMKSSISAKRKQLMLPRPLDDAEKASNITILASISQFNLAAPDELKEVSETVAEPSEPAQIEETTVAISPGDEQAPGRAQRSSTFHIPTSTV